MAVAAKSAMRELVVRFRISPELANLLFGVLASAAINVLTAVGVNGARGVHRYLVESGVLLLCAALASGALALVLARIRRALEGLSSPTLTVAEVRAEENVRYREAAPTILVLTVAMLMCLVGALVLFVV